METSYIQLLKKGTIQYRVQKTVFLFLLISLTVGVIYAFVISMISETLIMFLIMYLILGVFYIRNRLVFKSIQYWTNTIENKPEEVVWLKPIEVKHTAYFLITYAISYKYELYLKNGDHLNVMCPSEKRDEFIQIFQKYTPHIHYGYSEEAFKLYRKDKHAFEI